MTLLGSWSTYYLKTNTTTPNTETGDAKGFYKVFYEYEANNSRYKINVECYLKRKPTYYNTTYYLVPTVSGNIRSTVNSENGSQINFNKTYYTTTSNAETTELITTQTFYVYPDTSTGKSSVSFSGKINLTIASDTATRTCSHTWSLPTVAVSSSITNNTTNSSRINFGSSVTFTITPPAGSSGITHTLKYTVGGTEYTIANASSLVSIPYAFPTSLIDSFPNSGSPSITVTCTSSNGTTSTTEVYLQVPDNDTYRPTISISLQDVMNNKPSSLNGMWIKNKSLLQGTITATAKNGASISSYLSSISGFSTTYNTRIFTTVALTIAGSRTVTYSATDTRNLTKTGTQNITVVDYTTPSISSAKVERCNSSGTLDETGSYGKVTVTYVVSPLNNGSENKNEKTLTVKKDTDISAQTITTTNYSGTVSQVFNFSLTEASANTFTFTLTDIFGSVTYTYTIGTAFKTVSKRAGGKGIAFGKVATQDGFDCNMDAIFRGTLTGNLTGSATSASKLGTSSTGSTDRPIYLNAGSPAQCNTPASGNWFRGVPYVQSNGVMEMGRYIDFHPTNASTLDYSKRIDAGTGTTARTLTLPDVSGTIATLNRHETYSTTEQEIGTWVNGEIVYRKVLYIASKAKGFSNHNHGISNFKSMINVYGFCTISGKCQPIQRVVTDAIATYGIGIGDITSTVIGVQTGSSTGTATDLYIVMEYIKTS